MRLDSFLKVSRLVIRRTVAAELCRAGAVLVNATVAKPGREVKPDDLITLRRRGQLLQLRIIVVPTGNVPKSQAATLYEVLSTTAHNEVGQLLSRGERPSSFPNLNLPLSDLNSLSEDDTDLDEAIDD
jgi:ribosomal 50S subunit-recycling heat shock protein